MSDNNAASRGFGLSRKTIIAVALTAIVVAAFGSYAVIHFQSTTQESADDGHQMTSAQPLPAAEQRMPSASASVSASVSASASPSGSARASTSVSASPRSSARRPPASTGYPNASNTGVPAGTRLSAYGGPCTITADGAVIASKTVACDTLEIRARNIVIKKSKINGIVVTTERSNYSFTLQDSEVDAGLVQRAAVGSTNITILRSNIHGGHNSVTCAANCTIRDSYLHGQQMPAGSDWHLGGFLANDTASDNRTNATLVHNTIVCDNPGSSVGGCSGDVNLFADFGPVSYVTVENNLLGSGDGISYCVYGGSTAGKQYTDGVQHIVFVNNVFQRGASRKCGSYGPVSSFDRSRPGNRWENNRWDDGTLLQSDN